MGIQVMIIALFIYYVSGKLMGSQINFFKRILSVFISVFITLFVYWYAYLRNTDFFSENFAYAYMDVNTIIWIGSTLLISMLLYLFFELFGPMDGSENKSRRREQKTFLLKVRSQWRSQRRMRQVFQIAFKNGIARTLKYARKDNEKEIAIALRHTLEQSGGIFIKFGQVLSTRKDLFPPVFIEELGKLQQQVQPLSEDQVRGILTLHFPEKIEDIFEDFDMIPLASASIGQVHKATLKESNQQVVVKLLRPEIKEMIRDDLNILLEFVQWISDKSAWADSLGLCELAQGFADSLREEVNFEIEIRNALQIRNSLKESKYEIKIPHVYTELSNDSIIVFDYIDGESVAAGELLYDQLRIDRKEFAQTVLYSFFDQMLYSGIFHADPHPGNIFIDKEDGIPVLLDFGAVGRLAEPQQEGMKMFLIGIQHQDADMLYDALTLLVEEHEHIDRIKMEQEMGQVLLRISYIHTIPTEELIQHFFKVVRKFGLTFYPSVGMAMRSMVTLDGTLKLIKPDFDIFVEAQEYSTEYLISKIKKPFKEPKEVINRIEEEVALLLPTIRKIPRRIDKLVQRVEGGKITLHHDIFSDKNNSKFITHLFSRFILLMVGITFGIISVALLAIAQFIETAYAVYLNTAAYVGLFLCAVLLVRLSIQAIRLMKKS